MVSISVLLVDDNPSFLRSLACFLEEQNEIALRVVGMAMGGRDAVAKVDALQPAVVLVEPQMAKLPGLDILPQLRARRPEAFLIVLTLMDPAGARPAVLAAGADAFVSKASLETDLVPTIRRLVGERQATRPPVRCAAQPDGRPDPAPHGG
jgi:DNA-binding NarL/FixJ family response regulator